MKNIMKRTKTNMDYMDMLSNATTVEVSEYEENELIKAQGGALLSEANKLIAIAERFTNAVNEASTISILESVIGEYLNYLKASLIYRCSDLDHHPTYMELVGDETDWAKIAELMQGDSILETAVKKLNYINRNS